MDCSNPPRDDNYIEGTPMPQVIHINKLNRTCLVKIAPGKSVIAHLSKEMNEAIQLLDFVEIHEAVTPGEYNVTNYYVNTEIYNEEAII